MLRLTFEQQQAFAGYLRRHLPYDWTDKHLPLSTLTDYASRVLGRPVGHWRALSVEDAQRVMAAAKAGEAVAQ